MKAKNQNQKQSHKLNRIVLRRIKTVAFSSYSTYASVAFDPVKEIVSCKQKWKNQPITMPILRPLQYILPLVTQRIKTVTFSSYSTYASVAFDPVKEIVSCKQKWKNQPITMPILRPLQYILPLVTLTTQFSLDCE